MHSLWPIEARAEADVGCILWPAGRQRGGRLEGAVGAAEAADAIPPLAGRLPGWAIRDARLLQ